MSGFRQSFRPLKPCSRLKIASGMENVEGVSVKENVTIKSVLLPLVALRIFASVLEWTTGFDCTDVIPTDWVLWTIPAYYN